MSGKMFTETAVFNYKKDGGGGFDRISFGNRMKDGSPHIGEVIYDGGGNFWVLYKDRETCVGVNKLFTAEVMKNTYSVKVLCTFIEGVDFDDFKGDREKLYKKHRIREAVQSPDIPAQVLPCTRVDYNTSMPLYNYGEVNQMPYKRIPVTKESFYKYKKYWDIAKANKDAYGEGVLDNLVTQKGEESLLAVVYIDGNNMGAKVADCFRGSGYEDCINSLRKFSESIQKEYVDDRMKDIDVLLEKKYGEKGRRRFVIYAGDEINFICNARDAYDAAKVYLENLPEGCSACAGIAVFHSHAPYDEAYRIAEECCESGKKKMKELGLENVSLIDAHYCQAGIGTDLETIRDGETGGRVSRPWFVAPPKDYKGTERLITCDMLEQMAKVLLGTSRSNVKSLAVHAKNSMADLKTELRRIESHLPAGRERPHWHLENVLDNSLDDEEMSRLIYDAVIFYDLWFENRR